MKFEFDFCFFCCSLSSFSVPHTDSDFKHSLVSLETHSKAMYVSSVAAEKMAEMPQPM